MKITKNIDGSITIEAEGDVMPKSQLKKIMEEQEKSEVSKTTYIIGELKIDLSI